MEYGLVIIAGLGMSACVIVAWKLVSALTSLARSSIGARDRERIDQDRMMQIFIEKYQSGNPEQMAQIHAQEEFQKWKLTKKFDETSESELNAKRDIAKMQREEEISAGAPEHAQPYE